MHPVKRRRLEQVQVALNKPFRSPLRTPKNTFDDRAPSITRSRSPNVSTTIASDEHNASPAKVSKQQALTSTAEGSQNHYVLLTQKLNKTRQALEVAEQALQIVDSRQDIQLEALITKWTQIARDVADELFVDAKARIDDMGGFEAWQRNAQSDNLLWAEAKRHESPDMGENLTSQDDISTGQELASLEECVVDHVSCLLRPLCAH